MRQAMRLGETDELSIVRQICRATRRICSLFSSQLLADNLSISRSEIAAPLSTFVMGLSSRIFRSAATDAQQRFATDGYEQRL